MHQLHLRGYHDHSYGVRDWYSFHRYAINFAYLEDGTTFHVNTISMPGTLSHLQCGYLSMPSAVMHSATWTDMNMLDLGEDRNPPTHYEFNFKANSKMYHVRIESHTVFRYYLTLTLTLTLTLYWSKIAVLTYLTSRWRPRWG